MLRRIRLEAFICYGKPFEEMKGRIIAVDYAETNRLSKGYVKTVFGRVESISQSKAAVRPAALHRGTRSFLTKKPICPVFRDGKTKRRAKILNGEGIATFIRIKEVGTIPKQKKSITMILTTLTGNNHIGTIKIQTVGTKVTEYFRMVLGKGKCWNWRR